MVAEEPRETVSDVVVIGSGGFEWNPDLLRDYVYGPPAVAASPPFNEGDGLPMVQVAGAALANMGEAWWQACLSIPHEYAAANFMGLAYPGAGSTIGIAPTFGFLAGRHAAERND